MLTKKTTTMLGVIGAALTLIVAACNNGDTECNGECVHPSAPKCESELASHKSTSCVANEYGCYYPVSTHCASDACDDTTGLCAPEVDCHAITDCAACNGAVGNVCYWCGGQGCMNHGESSSPKGCTTPRGSDPSGC